MRGGRFTPLRGRLLAVAPLAAILATAGCGGDDHANEPRAPSPIEITARVGNKAVTVAPHEFGAGLVNITISNQSDEVVELTVEGKSAESQSIAASAEPIQPGAVDTHKLELPEGSYEVNAGEDSKAKPAELEVGPARASAQNQLLLP